MPIPCRSEKSSQHIAVADEQDFYLISHNLSKWRKALYLAVFRGLRYKMLNALKSQNFPKLPISSRVCVIKQADFITAEIIL